ncbi:hypothetical protein GDO78_018349 [Eleutherodactylus coqui]|uniref:Uncharacterized protein n=1 Tax=Eleutherodactylus coqui TaxID=57060 RepID=A0A8J6AZJ5_ELECQ|nr:hypothetical protein GDO78_018349 [Eleutherodactylus coqui]
MTDPPLWENPTLPSLQDTRYWTSLGIQVLGDIYEDNVMLTYTQLREKLQMPKLQLFRYFQLRYALNAQFPPETVRISKYPIVGVLRTPKD